MTSFRFDRFHLQPDDRRLTRDGSPVELNARYLDALALLVSEAGKLVSKPRFMDEVWRGVPVTDEALTQCIKTLRRQLGDDAAAPRFIETVPKHGYRFIAAVEEGECVSGETSARSSPPAAPLRPAPAGWRQSLLLGGAGTIGGGLAGLLGGLFYGLAAAAEPLQPGLGAASTLLVVVSVTIGVALFGAAGVSFGIAGARYAAGRGSPWMIAGGAAGGLTVGGLVKLLSLDAFSLLIGQSPGDITGAGEGFLLGGAVGLGAWLSSRGGAPRSLRRGIAVAAAATALAGIAITMTGGRLMGGSLALLAEGFPTSRLRLDQIGSWVGEPGFGTLSQILTGGMEGLLFGGGVVGAMLIARQQFDRPG
jgi:DNA-binding winged helix-turn-helix (wHTH) protein